MLAPMQIFDMEAIGSNMPLVLVGVLKKYPIQKNPGFFVVGKTPAKLKTCKNIHLPGKHGVSVHLFLLGKNVGNLKKSNQGIELTYTLPKSTWKPENEGFWEIYYKSLT